MPNRDLKRKIPDVVLFDLDGVLIDSSGPVRWAVTQALASVGLPQIDDMSCLHGPPLVVGFERLLERVGGDRSLAQICVARYRDHYEAKLFSEATVYPYVEAALAQIGSRSRMIVATMKPRRLAEPLLTAMGIRGSFTRVVGPHTDFERGPKSEIVATALRAERGAGAAMVGDCPEDVVAAHANGIPCVGALWGYSSLAELRAAGTNEIASSPRDLASALCHTT